LKITARQKRTFEQATRQAGKILSGMYEIEFSRKAAKFYQKVDTTTIRRLNAALSISAEDPFSHYSIKRLSGELKGSCRIRVGDIRII
jgi:mRNA-degrading endonuclease RelE of RelBE toxin-antitoxin system